MPKNLNSMQSSVSIPKLLFTSLILRLNLQSCKTHSHMLTHAIETSTWLYSPSIISSFSSTYFHWCIKASHLRQVIRYKIQTMAKLVFCYYKLRNSTNYNVIIKRLFTVRHKYYRKAIWCNIKPDLPKKHLENLHLRKKYIYSCAESG